MRQLVIELFVSGNGPATKHAMDHAVLYDNDFSKKKKKKNLLAWMHSRSSISREINRSLQIGSRKLPNEDNDWRNLYREGRNLESKLT